MSRRLAELPIPMRRYEERDDAPEPALDRLFAAAGHALGRYRRSRMTARDLAAAVKSAAAACDDALLPERLRALRYRLRRDGCTQPLVVEACTCCAVIARRHGLDLGPEALGAAAAMLQGRIAALASAQGRGQALAVAAWALAMSGVPVHLLTPDDPTAQSLAETLLPYSQEAGLAVAVVCAADDLRRRREAYRADIVCLPAREAGHDYLRDRLTLGARAHTLAGLIERYTSGSRSAEPLLPGLHAALVADAEVVMIDEAHAPLMLAAEAQQPETRLAYEQALEFARTLAADAHFVMETAGARLTASGRARLAPLVASLGGVWRAEQGRESLIEAALDALHAIRRDRDYRVAGDRVVFAPADGEAGEQDVQARALRERMVEIKEGCRMSARREVQARLPLPRFLRRYVRLAGAASDASGLEREFSGLYRARVEIYSPPDVRDIPVRVFREASARDGAVVDAVRAALDAHAVPVIAVRTPRLGKALAAALDVAGIEVAPADGAPYAEPQPGKAAMLIYPAHRTVGRRLSATTHLIMAELHDARRHVQQLCRVFEPAASVLMLALDDVQPGEHLGPLLPALRARYRSTPELPGKEARRVYAHCQRAAEKAAATTRVDWVARDVQRSDILAFTGQRD